MDNYFDHLNFNLLYIICEYLKSDYILGLNKNLDNSYLKFIDNIKNEYIMPFKRSSFDNLRLYPCIEKCYNTYYFTYEQIEKEFDITIFKKEMAFDLVRSKHWPYQILKESNIFDNIIYANWGYHEVPGIDTENMHIIYIDEKDNYVYYTYYSEDEDGKIVSNNWKVIWDRLSINIKKDILEYNGFNNMF